MEPWLESFAQTALRRAADTAHDLKTPLNVAILNLELLKMRRQLVVPCGESVAQGVGFADLALRALKPTRELAVMLRRPTSVDLRRLEHRRCVDHFALGFLYSGT